MKISEKGILFIEKAEGKSNKAYPDPATGGAPWTIGVGHTGPEVHKGLVWTDQQVHEAHAKDLEKFNVRVSRLIGESITTQYQFDALVSFAFNLGDGNLTKSTLLKMHKAGDYEGAANQFKRWNKAAGKVMKGLTTRRENEANMYRGK